MSCSKYFTTNFAIRIYPPVVKQMVDILETETGDVDLDGDVDAADLATANANLNQPGPKTYAQGDVNGDKLADFAINVQSSSPLTSWDFVL